MECYPKFLALSLYLVFVTTFVEFTASSHDQLQEPYSSIAHALGKEYILVQSDQNQFTLRTWNYSEDEIREFNSIRNKPLALKLTESGGEFLLKVTLEFMALEFQLGQEFICDRTNSTSKATLNGTNLMIKAETTEFKMDLIGEEMQVNYNVDSTPYTKSYQTITFRSKQSKNNSFPLNETESLPAELEKEYYIELSDNNRKIIREIGVTQDSVDVILVKYPLGYKLTKINETFIITTVMKVYEATFQLEKQTKDSRGLLSTFTLNGTTLTRVSHSDDGSAARTSVWKFGPDEVLYQEVKEDYNATLTFKATT